MSGLQSRLITRRGEFEIDINLHIAAGETLALLGPNGAGKSTTVSVLAGLIPLRAGSIHLGGRVLDDPENRVFVPPEERRVGVVFQDYVLFPHLTVLENVAFAAASRGTRRAEARNLATGWLEQLGIANLATDRPAQLSGGQAQRVALARTLAAEPAMLLLDEPLAALDVSSRTETRAALVRHLDEFKGPRLLITHEPAEAFLMADRVAIIENGLITQEGLPDDIRREPRTTYAADLAGINLLRGHAHAGTIIIDSGHVITVADAKASGAVLLTIHPRAISLHSVEPHGSPRNSWQAVVAGIQPLGERVRVDLDGPASLTAEITPGGAATLALDRGSQVWVSIKATEITVAPA